MNVMYIELTGGAFGAFGALAGLSTLTGAGLGDFAIVA